MLSSVHLTCPPDCSVNKTETKTRQDKTKQDKTVIPHGCKLLSLTPPGRFDFKRPDAWPKWKHCFQQYLTATELDKEEDAPKTSMLLYYLGKESEDVLTSTNIIKAGCKKYIAIVEKFDSFFNIWRNVINEHAPERLT